MLVTAIDYMDPLVAFAPFAGGEGAMLFDSAASAGGRGKWTFLCVEPSRLIIDPPDPFDALAALHADLPSVGGTAAHPFPCGIAGWLSYEAGRHAERMPAAMRADDLGVPETAFGLYDVVAAFDMVARRAWVLALPGREVKAADLAGRLRSAAPLPPVSTATTPMQAELSPAEAARAVATVIDYICAGDIFQANVTQRFLAEALPPGLDVFSLYRRLRDLSPAPFAAMARFGDAHLLSASPERFIALSADGRIETRPIKGTRPRGRTTAEDAALAADLLASAKDRAENLMIVDLLRNDLSRVAELGSVRVPTLCGLETFASVHHLVSVVEARLQPGLTAIDLLRAAFPGGSITGAPKVRAMEIIAELEPARRGLYCGALFRLGADGGLDSSILIRSLVVGRSGRICAQAGGGIVADSDPASEIREAYVKVRPLVRALSGEELICSI